MRFSAAVATVLILGSVALGQYCRTISYPAATYYAPTYSYTPVYKSYDYVYKEVQVVPQKDYYFSVSDGYRDALIADAVAYRVLAAMGKAQSPAGLPRYKEPEEGGVAPAESPAPAHAPPRPRAPGVAVNPELQKYANDSCVTCHSRPGRMQLGDLGKLTHADRLEVWWQLTTQRMPKAPHKKPTDEQMRLWAEYIEPSLSKK